LYVTQLPRYDLLTWDSMKSGIDFQPRYQRKNNLWSKEVKQLFINTILNEYDFPKIYLADFSSGISNLNESKKLFAVIDGKQRLSTIFDFFENNLVLDDTPIYTKGDYITLKGLRFSDLRKDYPLIAKRLEDYVPTVMGVVTDREADIYEMFIRLNLNVSISGPEKRNAMPGPIPPHIRQIAVHPFFKEKISFNTDRSQELSTACQFMMIEHYHSFVNIKKKDLDNFVKRGVGYDSSLFESTVSRVIYNLELMCEIFVHTYDKSNLPVGDPLLSSTTQMPLYYMLCKEFARRLSPLTIRSFIEFFEKIRLSERKMANSRAAGQIPLPGLTQANLDQDLIRYNSLIRSPDDKKSLEEMYGIMLNKLNTYKK